ncbi:hypothetical protein GKE82_17030 [Conexibacter sp. W3-3-2]|uniref:hypothetical protein n=1 Tax=Conexibacter sp. W3-3-2 TaxID=2675227 RepID=UPI0012B9D164|nr:hypothetical protein [Conexibacter sp. W3-3-2]MTD45944.1 hypothetical protein [Conexibacter sp. W3-3-2]
MRLRPLLPALALLALPSPALAADLAPAAAGAADALAAGGGGFAFTVRDLPSNRVRTRVGSPGGPTRTVSTSRPAGRREYGLAAGVARSFTRLAFGVTRLRTALDDEEPTALAGETFSGPLGGPFAVTAGGPGLARPFSTVVGYGGETLVTFEAEREFGAGRIVARDPAAGTAGRQIGPDAVIEARVAGTNVAIATETSPSAPATTITVYDLASGEQRYAVAVPRSVAPDGGGAATVPFDVDADGTIVAIGRSSSSTSATERLDLLVASPQATAPRVLRQDVTGAVVAISSGRVLHLARPSARVTAAGAVVLAVTGLAGSTSTVSFPLAPPVLADLDGDVLSVSTPTCVYAASFPLEHHRHARPEGHVPADVRRGRESARDAPRTGAGAAELHHGHRHGLPRNGRPGPPRLAEEHAAPPGPPVVLAAAPAAHDARVPPVGAGAPPPREAPRGRPGVPRRDRPHDRRRRPRVHPDAGLAGLGPLSAAGSR